MSQEPLDEARAALRRGLLEEARSALAAVAQDAPPSDQASAALLAGNVAYERGRYAEAADHWERAAGLFARVQPGGPGEAASRGNLELAHERLARDAGLHAQAGWLRLEVGLALLAAGLVVALLARRTG